LLERPLSVESVSDDLFAPPLRSFLRERFVLVESGAGLWLYARRDRAHARQAKRERPAPGERYAH
jgi:hypothetical protein